MRHFQSRSKYLWASPLALLLAFSMTPRLASEPDPTLAVTLQMPLMNGELHQMRVRCVVCKGLCGSTLTPFVASGEVILGFGGLGNHSSPNRTEIVSLSVERGKRITDADAYSCDFEMRHYAGGTDVFEKPLPADDISASSLWRTALCGTAFVPTVSGAYKATGEAFRARPLQFTGIPREN